MVSPYVDYIFHTNDCMVLWKEELKTMKYMIEHDDLGPQYLSITVAMRLSRWSIKNIRT